MYVQIVLNFFHHNIIFLLNLNRSDLLNGLLFPRLLIMQQLISQEKDLHLINPINKLFYFWQNTNLRRAFVQILVKACSFCNVVSEFVKVTDSFLSYVFCSKHRTIYLIIKKLTTLIELSKLMFYNLATGSPP